MIYVRMNKYKIVNSNKIEYIPLTRKPIGLYNKMLYSKKQVLYEKTKLNESLYFMYLRHNCYREIYKKNNIKIKEINYKNNLYHGVYKEWDINSKLQKYKLYYKGKIIKDLNKKNLSLKESSLLYIIKNNLYIEENILEIL